MIKLLGVLYMVFLAYLPAISQAQHNSVDVVPIDNFGITKGDVEKRTAKLGDLTKRLNRGIAEFQALSVQLDRVPEPDREALMYRWDERGFTLLEELDELARLAAKLPDDDPMRRELTERMRGEFAGAGDAVLDSTRNLSRRIAQYTAESKALGGTAQLALDAYIYGLKNLRIRSYKAAANLVEGRVALGLPADSIMQTLQEDLYVHAEILVGRLKSIRAALNELAARLADDPQNADISAALAQFSALHANELKHLTAISKVMASLKLDDTPYKTVLVQQGQEISVLDIGSDLILDLLRDSWGSIQKSLVKNGPNLLLKLTMFIAILLIFRTLSRLAKRAVILACDRSGADTSTLLKDVLASVTGGTVMVIGVLMALAPLGISLGPMLAGLGVAGFVVGFALQDTLGNFAAGGMILLYRPYDVDDFVEVTGASGLVKKMSLVSTTITTFDNQTLVVPNSKIWGDVIKNVTAQRLRRVDLEFGIGYSDDVEHAERVLEDILDGHDMVLSKPAPMIKLHSLADSSVNFVVRPWVKTEDYWDVYWDITREVKMRFDREGISIPFPQRDVHMYQEEA